MLFVFQAQKLTAEENSLLHKGMHVKETDVAKGNTKTCLLHTRTRVELAIAKEFACAGREKKRKGPRRKRRSFLVWKGVRLSTRTPRPTDDEGARSKN